MQPIRLTPEALIAKAEASFAQVTHVPILYRMTESNLLKFFRGCKKAGLRLGQAYLMRYSANGYSNLELYYASDIRAFEMLLSWGKFGNFEIMSKDNLKDYWQGIGKAS